MKYWLMKSEPDVYSIDQLFLDKTTWWEGVRNYQARNLMMKDMQVNDLVLFYHSNAEPPGIAGIAKVSQPAHPDRTQFHPKSEYFDSRATPTKPLWYCVEISFVEKFSRFVPLSELKNNAKLNDMLVLKKGQRLSVQPVSESHFKIILNHLKST